MSRPGFHLSGLRLTGPGVPPAELRFRDGLNVVSGPSDTGKTFILQCIDFMLGAGRPPKTIPEATAYDVGLLGLVSTANGAEFVLERGLRGGAARLYRGNLDSERDRARASTLGAKHQPDNSDTISGFLLSLCDVFGKRVRTNARGTTRQLSFRDLAHLTLIDEERIITTLSPIHTSNYTARTAEASVFRLLLTGVDDSGVVEEEDAAIARGRRNAQVEVVEQLVQELHEDLVALGLPGESFAALRERLGAVDARLAAATETLGGDQQALTEAERRRKGAWFDTQRAESRVTVLDGLLARFDLLGEHYRSDLARLEAIAEASFALDQFPVRHCPLCGAPADWQDHEHAGDAEALARISETCAGEAQRIHALLRDLESTASETRREREEVDGQRANARARLEDAVSTIRRQVEPRVRAAASALRALQAERDRVARGVDVAERLVSLEQRRADLAEGGPSGPRAGTQATSVAAGDMEQFCLVVEDVLRSWRYPGLTRVVFSEEERDLVISGRARASHGKGIRAISHAAFVVGLLRYCNERGLPHTAAVVLDSPLVAYREPDERPEERLGPDVKHAFYESLARGIPGGQVIVLENEDPAPDLRGTINHVHFTKTHDGRYGFIPVAGGR